MPGLDVFVLPQAAVEVDRLPGHIRQRIRRAIIGLSSDMRPPRSQRLDYASSLQHELRRLRLDAWRIVYLIDHEWNRLYVLAVRRRPPYQYEDLASLLERVK
jgi:mRNA-degrading endonuclease RelE of RelBE toxin-antitoxin system